MQCYAYMQIIINNNKKWISFSYQLYIPNRCKYKITCFFLFCYFFLNGKKGQVRDVAGVDRRVGGEKKCYLHTCSKRRTHIAVKMLYFYLSWDEKYVSVHMCGWMYVCVLLLHVSVLAGIDRGGVQGIKWMYIVCVGKCSKTCFLQFV